MHGNSKKGLKALTFYNNLFPNKDIGIQLNNINLSNVSIRKQYLKPGGLK